MLRPAGCTVDAAGPQVAWATMPVQVPPVPVESTGDLGPQDRSQAWTWLGVAVLGFLAGRSPRTSLARSASGSRTPPAASLHSRSRLLHLSGSSPSSWWVCGSASGARLTRSRATAGMSGSRSGSATGGTSPWDLAWSWCSRPSTRCSTRRTSTSRSSTCWARGRAGCSSSRGSWSCSSLPCSRSSTSGGVVLRAFLALTRTEVPWVGVAIAVVMDGLLFGLAHLGNDGWVQLPGTRVRGHGPRARHGAQRPARSGDRDARVVQHAHGHRVRGVEVSSIPQRIRRISRATLGAWFQSPRCSPSPSGRCTRACSSRTRWTPGVTPGCTSPRHGSCARISSARASSPAGIPGGSTASPSTPSISSSPTSSPRSRRM